MSDSTKLITMWCRSGDVTLARGYGWKYESVGDVSQFRQHKKIPSIRVVKSLIKKLKQLCEDSENE